MKKLMMIVTIAIIILGAVQNNTKKDVVAIDDYSYKVIYNTGREKIHTFDTELEMAETYTNEWYEIHE